MTTALTTFQAILTVLATAFLLPAAAHAQDEPKGDRERGESLYSRYCRGCHGEEGKGDGLTLQPQVNNPRHPRRSLISTTRCLKVIDTFRALRRM